MQMQSICIAGTLADCRHHRNALLVREEWGRNVLFTAKNCLKSDQRLPEHTTARIALVSLPALLNGREARCYRGVVFVVMHKLDALRVNRPAALKAKKCPYSLIRAVD